MRKFIFLISLISLSLLIVNCGEEGGGGGNENYIPHKEGSTWTYNCVENQIQPYEQTVLVKGTREVCGKNCQIEETLVSEVFDGGEEKRLEERSIGRAIFPQEFLLFISGRNDFEFIGWWNKWGLSRPLQGTEAVDRPITIIRRK